MPILLHVSLCYAKIAIRKKRFSGNYEDMEPNGRTDCATFAMNEALPCVSEENPLAGRCVEGRYCSEYVLHPRWGHKQVHHGPVSTVDHAGTHDRSLRDVLS